jgi:hypothetical protein
MNIVDYYTNNTVEQEFDEEFYNKEYSIPDEFYGPDCMKFQISERQRLFFHFLLFGRKFGLNRNLAEKNKKAREWQREENRLKGGEKKFDSSTTDNSFSTYMNIVDYFKENAVEHDFDEEFYNKEYSIPDEFYGPDCMKFQISERKRLFYHYILFGKRFGLAKNQMEKLKKIEERRREESRLRGRDIEPDLSELEKYFSV